MEIELSAALKEYIKAQGKVFLSACPGSGKTTTVAYKLSNLTSEWKEHFAGIACISFTNIAKDEINQKYSEFSEEPLKFPHLVCTLDSFINQYITLPYFYLFEPTVKRPKLIEDGEQLNAAWERKVWTDRSLAFKTKSNQLLHKAYAPIDVHVEINGSFSWKGKTPKVDDTIFQVYGRALKKWQIRERGLLAIHDSAYIAHHLMKKFPRIGQWLAARFPIIIVDEAQDTSEIQFSILEMIAKSGLISLEFVGDPYQCLYEWRNANPEILVERTKSAEWEKIDLTDNWRSQKNIIDCFSRLRREGDGAIVQKKRFDVKHQILIVTYSEHNESEAVEKFSANLHSYLDNHIVVRSRSLRNKLLGNKRSSDKSLWKDSLPEILINGKKSFNTHEIKQGVAKLRMQIPRILEPTSNITRRYELLDELKADYQVSALLFWMMRNLPSLELPVSRWTENTQEFIYQALNTLFVVKDRVDFGLKKGKYQKYYDQTVKEVYGESVSAEIPISTIHQVKGMTCDSLLLILSTHSKGQNISIHDIKKPTAFPSEKQRMIYVAMSRPRHLLAIGVPDSTPEDLIIRTFGHDVEIVDSA